MGLLSSYLGGDDSGGLASSLLKRKKKGMKRDSSHEMDHAPIADPSSYSKGGMVRRSGMAKVHKGERVLTRKQARRYRGK